MECWFPGPDIWPGPLACLRAQEMGSWGSAKAQAQGPFDVWALLRQWKISAGPAALGRVAGKAVNHPRAGRAPLFSVGWGESRGRPGEPTVQRPGQPLWSQKSGRRGHERASGLSIQSSLWTEEETCMVHK